jgi:hypothetical protein
LRIFSVEDRDRAQARVLALAEEDERVVAGAIVGSLVTGGDHLSDLDLTFAVADDVPVGDVLEEWSRVVEAELGGVLLFDLPAGPSIYRVFMLPGCLQFDLSFTPAAQFGATSPRFRLLFGQTGERSFVQPPPARELFGYAVHHTLRARFAIERGRMRLAEYWVSSVRDYALSLACVQRGLPSSYGRGWDDLPADTLALFDGAIVRSLEREELLRALRVAVDGLLHEGGDLAGPVAPDLAALLDG